MYRRAQRGMLALVGTPPQPSSTASHTSQPTLTLLPSQRTDTLASGERTSGSYDPRGAIDAAGSYDPRTSKDAANAERTSVPADAVAPFLDGESNTDAVLDVDDVARLMRVGRNTIYALVGRNQIPHRRLGKQIRFSRASVMSWLATSWQVAKEGK